MPDFLLELLSEEIPARMQAKASADLARLFAEKLGEAGLYSQGIETYATPRRLVLIARGLPAETAAAAEELKGPRASAPPQALEGFLRKTGLTREQLVERDGVLFATIEKPGRATASVLAEAIPQIVRAFPWPKSMRWGSGDTRWVRPLQGIVALFGEDIVDFEVAGIASGAATVGHRFHHPGIITIGGAHDYAEKLRACHVILDPAERRRIIAEGAAAAAREAGLTLVEDEGLLDENAGLTEWPVPLVGSFDPAFLEVPREVIQLTMRTNQKYFALNSSPGFPGEGDRAERGGGAAEGGSLAPNFICVANIEASDGGAAIIQGNERVLSARLSDAKFFWEQDLKVPLKKQAKKLSQIVFHEKLGTVADKVERVAKLARWLVEEGIVGGSTPSSATISRHSRESGNPDSAPASEEFDANALDFDLVEREANNAGLDSRFRGNDEVEEVLAAIAREERAELASQAETAARLSKADLVTQMVGEFPELQGIIGGHIARVQGHPAEIADAIRDHYKPVGQSDEVPTMQVTVAVSLADKLDTLIEFFSVSEAPTGSRDPYALRRAALGAIRLIESKSLRLKLKEAFAKAYVLRVSSFARTFRASDFQEMELYGADEIIFDDDARHVTMYKEGVQVARIAVEKSHSVKRAEDLMRGRDIKLDSLLDFFADRLKVQQREAGVRHDLIDAVFALGGEDDLVRLLARVKALQAFVETAEGADLLAGYKRAANILKRENWPHSPSPLGGEGRVRGAAPAAQPAETPQKTLSAADAAGPSPLSSPPRGEENVLSYMPENEEAALIDALDSAEPKARAAIQAEDFEGAMAALASLRAPVDAFFDKVTVNDPDPAKRESRLNLLLRMRDAVHQVADFSKIEG